MLSIFIWHLYSSYFWALFYKICRCSGQLRDTLWRLFDDSPKIFLIIKSRARRLSDDKLSTPLHNHSSIHVHNHKLYADVRRMLYHHLLICNGMYMIMNIYLPKMLLKKEKKKQQQSIIEWIIPKNSMK